jgi:branched-chain amino acid transport system substrate-binding protein
MMVNAVAKAVAMNGVVTLGGYAIRREVTVVALNGEMFFQLRSHRMTFGFIPRALVGALAIGLIAGSLPARADQPPIKIGVVLSYSGGDNVVLGKMADAAFAAYMKEHGDTIAGRKVVLIKRDDTGIAPETAKRLAQELIVQEHVDMLIGASYTPNAIAIGAVSTQAKVPYFIVNAATAGIMAKNPYTSRWGFTTGQIAQPFAKWAFATGSRTAYVVFQDYGPGIDAGTTFEKNFVASGGRVLGESRIPVGSQDFTAYIQKVKDAKPDVMFLFINASGGGIAFIKAMRSAGLGTTKFLATGDLVDEALLPTEGDGALGITTTYTYSAMHDSALNKQFIRDFQAAYGSKQLPDFVAVQSYDALAAVYKAVAAQKGQIDPDKTMEIVKTLKFESPRGPIQIDPATRDLVQTVYFRRVERRNGVLGNYEFTQYRMASDPIESGQ